MSKRRNEESGKARRQYLSLLMDLYSRRVVGWEYQDSMTDALVLSSLKKAIRERQPATGLIHLCWFSGNWNLSRLALAS